MSRTRAAADGDSSSMIDMARDMAPRAPASTRSASEGDAVTSGSQQLTRDHQTLHFARALTNGDELDVAKVLFARVVFDEAVSAVNLDAVLGRAYRSFARVELGHRRRERDRASLIFFP